MSLEFTSKETIEKTCNRLVESFHSGKTLPLKYRDDQLRGLVELLVEHRGELVAALEEDLKCPQEAQQEWSRVYTETILMIENLQEWSKPTQVQTSIAFYLDNCWLRWEPRGVALIIGAWNYPLDLVLMPLCGAIAAGCPAVIKPAEDAAATARLLARLIPQYLDTSSYAVILGGPKEAGWLLERPDWGLVFFTGGSRVGRIVYEAAAKHLTPVILELGGCNPCLVMADAKVESTARRIVHGRFVNAGQTCISPNTVWCDERLVDALQKAILEAIVEFYGAKPDGRSFGRQISLARWDAVKALLDGLPAESLVYSGGHDREARFFGPHVVRLATDTAEILSKEIFGPILVIVPVKTDGADPLKCLMKAAAPLGPNQYPLVAYIFGEDSKQTQRFIEGTKAGAIVVNDTLTHYVVDGFPFGGTGHSGIGVYHGRWSFQAFSHAKPVMERGSSAVSEWTNRTARYPTATPRKPTWMTGVLLGTLYKSPSRDYYRKK